jgi:malate dehydrogenase (oxaloacetate-decarboxylating)(NADP+)
MSADATKTQRPAVDGHKRRTEVRKRMRLEIPHGLEILQDPAFNKGTAFTVEEREHFDIRGLLPPGVATPEMQERRVLENYRRKPSDLERYIFLSDLQDRNETLFYRILINNIEKLMPIVYTPTVGTACKVFGHIWRRPHGLYISAADRGEIARVLANWPYEAEIIVVTDGERILGLGDLGANGMGIPIGKLALYTACAGVHPESCLPVTLDVGTDNEDLLQDPLYLGLRQNRLRGAEYADFVEEFVAALEERFPGIVLQFEDFATRNAFTLLQRYRDRLCAFNDDIQGTAAVVLAGLLSAQNLTGRPFTEERLIFLGAGEAAVGIADLIVAAQIREGVDEEAARARIWFLDSKGLVVKERTDLQPHKLRYAQDHPFLPDLGAAVEAVQPTGLIGVSGQPGTFTEGIVRKVGELNERPIIFALSNPTANSECTAEQAYTWTGGRAIFASGSPFDPVDLEGRTLVPGQANNAYIFPGVGLGLIVSGAQQATDGMFYAAARTLAGMVPEEALQQGCLFPPLTQIRDVSSAIATAVAGLAYERELASKPRPHGKTLADHVRAEMYEPVYPVYV